jgi:hypothetical protein
MFLHFGLFFALCFLGAAFAVKRQDTWIKVIKVFAAVCLIAIASYMVFPEVAEESFAFLLTGFNRWMSTVHAAVVVRENLRERSLSSKAQSALLLIGFFASLLGRLGLVASAVSFLLAFGFAWAFFEYAINLMILGHAAAIIHAERASLVPSNSIEGESSGRMAAE